MIGKAGLVGFPAAFTGIEIRCLCISQIFCIKSAVIIENLCVTDAKLRSFRFLYSQTNPAGKMLSEIKNLFSVFFPLSADGNIFNYLDWRYIGVAQDAGGVLADTGIFPSGSIKSRITPAGLFQPGIVVFPVKNTGKGDRRAGDLPTVIAADDMYLPLFPEAL